MDTLSTEEKSLHKLSSETRAKLRSTQILTSLPQIVSELLQNSLDAGARHVEIGVDCQEWNCWIRDDGPGISKADLVVLGTGSGGRYGTSKAYNITSLESVSTFGFRGEALASAADLSCLEISSRTSRSRESWSVILKGGKSLYTGPSIRWRRESHGTVVCIRDAFFNLPIRRLSHPSPHRTIEIIRQEVEAYALVFPHVSFSLEDASKAKENHSAKGQLLRIPKTNSTLTAFCHIYGRALTKHVEEINSEMGELKLKGFISLVGAHSKSYQFLYVNRHPLSSCDLHRLIDNKFNSSSFVKHAYDEGGETNLRSSARRSPRKAEKRPIYVLNMTIPPRYIDNCLEPAKSSVHLENKNVVLSFLSTIIQSFLSRHGFSIHHQEQDANEDSSSPRKRRKITSEPSGDNNARTSLALIQRAADHKAPAPLFIRQGDDLEPSSKISWQDPVTGEMFIVDTRTGNSFSQNAPGPIVDENVDDIARGRRTLISSRSTKKGKDPGVFCDSDTTQESIPEWLRDALNANEAYAITEPKIPSISLPSNTGGIVDYEISRTQHHSCHGQGTEFRRASRYFQHEYNVEPNTLLRRFRKKDLANARVVNQVDRKFIACLIDNGLDSDILDTGENDRRSRSDEAGGKVLVLIDQHAADERIRVERYLKDLCLGSLRYKETSDGGVEIRKLSPLVPVLLTRHEASCLASEEQFQKAFECWGVHFADLQHILQTDIDEGEGEGNDGYIQVFVSAIPDVVGEKLLMGDELRELIKGFLAKLKIDGPDFTLSVSQHSQAPEEEDEEFRWLKALRWCPRELLELINSKACRGAIMFNDSLSLDQCERLVCQLSETAFPFQCAHGRPSLVPLTRLNSETGGRVPPRIEWDKLSL